MAIAEDASAPAAVTSTGTTTTTASFTPVANSLLVAIANAGNNTGAGTITCPVTDSLGSTWTLLKRTNIDLVNGAGSTEVWVMDAGASPAARTVTATGTGGANAVGTSLCVKVLTGAKPVASVLGASANPNGGNNYTIALTTTVIGSLVVGGLSRITSAVTLTANGSTTAWQSVSDGTNTETYGAWRALNLTGTPGADTYGYTNAAAAAQVLVAVELLAAPSAAPVAPQPGRAFPSPMVLARNVAHEFGVVAAAGAAGAMIAEQRSEIDTAGAKATTGTGTAAGRASVTSSGIKQVTGAAVAAGRATTTDAARKQSTGPGAAATRATTTTTGIKTAAGAAIDQQRATTTSSGANASAIGGVGAATGHITTAASGRKGSAGAAVATTRGAGAATGVKAASGAAGDQQRVTTTATGRKGAIQVATAPSRSTSTSAGIHRGVGTGLASIRAETRSVATRTAVGVGRTTQRSTTISTGQPPATSGTSSPGAMTVSTAVGVSIAVATAVAGTVTVPEAFIGQGVAPNALPGSMTVPTSTGA